MQPHFRVRTIIVDQESFRRVRIARDLVPQLQQWVRNGGPRLAGVRMEALIAIAALVRNPAEGTAIRHRDRHWPAGLWHAWREQRRSRQYARQRREQGYLSLPAEIVRIKAQPAGANLQIHRFASLAFMGFLPLVATFMRRRLSSSGPFTSKPTRKSTRTLPPPVFSLAAVRRPCVPAAACGARLMQDLLPCRPMMPTYMTQGNHLAQLFWTAGAMRWV